MITPGGGALITDELLTQISSRLVSPGIRAEKIMIKGASGTGKTELLQNLMRQYYCDAASPSLFATLKKYTYIPILVRMRSLSGQTILELVQNALRGNDMPFEDPKTVERLLRAGNFLILLDGVNEVDMDKEVRSFIATTSVRTILTSQKELEDSDLPTYKLALMNEAFATKLLHSFLPQTEENEIAKDVPPTLWVDMISGYDVRLLADLIQAKQALPSSRLGLFYALLDYAVKSSADASLSNAICSAAWDLWKTRMRRFDRIDSVSDTQWSFLSNKEKYIHIIAKRGDKYEFRHDLLRGYLAANFAARQVASIAVTCNLLTDEAIWNLPVSDQDDVFGFLTQMLINESDLQRLGQFAADDPDIRTRLLNAVLNAATANNWTIIITPGKKSDSTTELYI